jgi:antimicrobial peptide system SdpA family protein
MESFGFFTRDPKEKQLSLYTLEVNKLKKIDLRTNSSENLYGLSRIVRVKTIELGKIQQKIPDSLWMSIKSDSLLTKNFKDLKSFRIKRSGDIRFIPNGKYILCNYTNIPWEWNKHLKNYDIDYAFIEID